MTWVSFWSYLTSLVAFVCKTDHGDGERQKVPEDVAKYVYERCKSWLPRSPTIVYSPVLLADGSLLETPGYKVDKEHGLNHLLILADDFVWPKPPVKPTKQDALNSLKWIRLELLNDFPFLDTDEQGVERRDIGEAHALAMIFTMFMRDMIAGRTPMFMASKPEGGTGGSFLIEQATLIHEGESAGYIEYTNDPDELSKRIISAIRSGTKHMFFDDVEEMKSKVMHRCITAPKVRGRRMGTNDIVEAPNFFVWEGSGNNPDLDDQMDRRSVWIRMNLKKSNVLDRKFRHDGEGSVSGLEYEEFCRKNRGTIISHILTIILYWQQLGEPFFSGKKKASFPMWSAMVGGVLECVGVTGFLQGKSGVLASPQIASDRAFMQEWILKYDENPASPKEAFDWADLNKSLFLSGKGDDEKQRKFLKNLQRLSGKTFKLKAKDDGVFEYRLMSKLEVDGWWYHLNKEKEPEDNNAGP
jgi:hypothetical protein